MGGSARRSAQAQVGGAGECYAIAFTFRLRTASGPHGRTLAQPKTTPVPCSGIQYALELGPKAHDGFRVDLADAGFGDAENAADLFHVEIFVIVE
jgi:hypothetical protein